MEGAMRECLAQGAWCDVRLACGGREFRAHRVVLSSVSPFLRMLLKSRPDEDIPATIVMPEFEVEALSAVLHYVYNGEVSVPTQHLDAFFTIVKTLQICVDKTALIGFREKIEDFDTKILDVEVFRKVITARIVPALKNVHEGGVSITTPRLIPGSMESKQLDLENVIKGDRICKSVSPYLNDTPYSVSFPERSASRHRCSESSISNPHNADIDRAPESPARDSTPRRPAPSGNNGPATCVPTITNVDNLGSTSPPPVTNAALAGPMSRKISNPARMRGLAGRRQRAINEPPGLPKRLECAKLLPNITFGNELSQVGHHADPHSDARLNMNDGWRENCLLPPPTNGAAEAVQKPAVLRPVPTLLPLGPMYKLPPPAVVDRSGYFRPPPDLLDLSSPHLSRVDFLRSHCTEEFGMSLLSTHLNEYSRSLHGHSFDPYRVSDDVRLCESSSREVVVERVEGDRNFARRAAYNKVLAGPWCPRGPPTYRPPPPVPPPPPPPPPLIYTNPVLPSSLVQTQASERLTPTDSLAVDYEEKSSNDDNNNVREVRFPSPPAAAPPASTDPAPPNPHSIDAIIGKDSTAPVMRCDTCDKVFTCRATLEAHARAHGGGGGAGARHTCADCGKSFSQLRNFKYHVSVHRGTREFAATCNVCGKYFNDRGYLSSHMKIHRNRKEYECPHCPKSFNQRVAYNMHVRIHTGVKPHVCAECGKAFSRKMLLKQHQRTHSGERPYACSVCDKRFADRSNMTLHMRLHSGVKPFSCTLCPKSFTKKHHLKTHLNYHTGDKPYSCPRCRLAFSQSSNMRTHLKKCSATLPPPPPQPQAHPAPAATPTPADDRSPP